MVCVPLRYVSVTLESKFRVRGAMRGNDGRDAVIRVRVRVRIAIMHIVLRCRTGSLSSCAELDSGFEAVFRSFP